MTRHAPHRALLAATVACLAPAAAAQFPVEPAEAVHLLTSPSRALTADLDGDGHLDVAVFEKDGLNHRMATLLGDGAGDFSELLGDNAAEVDIIQDLADLDGDGELDVLFGGTEARRFLGVGDGSFGPFGQLISGLPISDDTIDGNVMRAADIDGDGDQDVVLADDAFSGLPFQMAVKLLLNDGAGNFSLGQALGSSSGSPFDLLVADLDGDGKRDVLALRFFSSVATHWDGDASDSWSEVATWNLPAGTQDLELADLDGDGALDLAGVAGSFLWTKPGSGGGFGPTTFTALDGDANRVRFADLDLDGAADAAVSESASFLMGQTELLRGQGDGSFGAAQVIEHGLTKGLLALGDFDGNGAPDLLSAEGGPDGVVELHALRNYATTPWSDLGDPLAGLLGSPILLGAGSLLPGEAVTWDLHRLADPPFLVIGVSELGAPFKGGTLHPAPDVVVGGIPVDFQGSASISLHWPSIAGGFPIVLQAWIPDGTAPASFAATNGLRGDVP